MLRKFSFAALVVLCLAGNGDGALPVSTGQAVDAHDARPLVVAQISDLHIGLRKNGKTQQPIDPVATLRRVIARVNEHHPDLVLVTGDVGETPAAWDQARQELQAVQAPLKFVPGNHDVTSTTVERWRAVFGPDYYKFRVRNVVFYMIDSQLLGNYTNFSARQPEPLPPAGKAEADKMLKWLENEIAAANKGDRDVVRIAVQHVPTSRGVNKVPDEKPYWITQEPQRSREIYLLQQLDVKHILAGHWHKFVNFDEHGFTHHIAPATSWATEGGLGFTLHTIGADGTVKTEMVELK